MTSFLPVLPVALIALTALIYYLSKTPSIGSIPPATPHIPLFGNVFSFINDPIKFLLVQRKRHGDIFSVNLGIIHAVFVLGPKGTNEVFRGTERSGLSFWAAMPFVFGSSVSKCKTSHENKALIYNRCNGGMGRSLHTN